MKRIITVLLSLALLILLTSSAFAIENEPLPPTEGLQQLSEMTESECIDFIKQYGVAIPDDYEEDMWGLL